MENEKKNEEVTHQRLFQDFTDPPSLVRYPSLILFILGEKEDEGRRKEIGEQ